MPFRSELNKGIDQLLKIHFSYFLLSFKGYLKESQKQNLFKRLKTQRIPEGKGGVVCHKIEEGRNG
jgi:hypothetical protein